MDFEYENSIPAVDVRPAIRASEIHILLVDDERLSRMVVTNVLEKCGYKVTPCDSGTEAQELVSKGASGEPFPYTLLLLDVVMPSVSGIELLKLVRASPRLAGVSVVMMSCHENAGTVFDCIRRGADDYLLKPVSAKEVNWLWQHVWRRRKNAHALSVNSVGGSAQPEDEDLSHHKGDAAATPSAEPTGDRELTVQGKKRALSKDEETFENNENGEVELYTAEEMRMHCISQIEKYKKVLMLIQNYPELFPGPNKRLKVPIPSEPLATTSKDAAIETVEPPTEMTPEEPKVPEEAKKPIPNLNNDDK